MIAKHETGEEGIENKVKVERYVVRIPPPPLMQLPWPGYKFDLAGMILRRRILRRI